VPGGEEGDSRAGKTGDDGVVSCEAEEVTGRSSQNTRQTQRGMAGGS
jgi:hypothetical protein